MKPIVIWYNIFIVSLEIKEYSVKSVDVVVIEHIYHAFEGEGIKIVPFTYQGVAYLGISGESSLKTRILRLEDLPKIISSPDGLLGLEPADLADIRSTASQEMNLVDVQEFTGFQDPDDMFDQLYSYMFAADGNLLPEYLPTPGDYDDDFSEYH